MYKDLKDFNHSAIWETMVSMNDEWKKKEKWLGLLIYIQFEHLVIKN